MKILLTGKTGQVGWRLARLLPRIAETVVTDRESLDLARPDSIREVIRAVRPDIIVNAAGFTHVDRAELAPEVTEVVNAVAPGILAEEAKRIGALLVHYSSVFVFDGVKAAPYDEHDAAHPVNIYGASKLAGDQAVLAATPDYLILRASWVYDTRGHNFLLTMLRLACERDELQVVDDQVGSPMWAAAIAQATFDILRQHERARAASGLYHLPCEGRVDRFEFTRRLLEATRRFRGGASPRLERIKTVDFPLPAARPLNASLASDRLRETFGIQPTPWQDQLAACLAELRADRTSGGHRADP